MPNWIRVKDKTTGHKFDLPEAAVEAYGDGIEVVKDAEPNTGDGAHPRPPEYATTRTAGKPAEKKEQTR